MASSTPSRMPPHHRAGDVAYPSHDGRRERLEAEAEPHVIGDLAVIQPHHDPGGPAERRANEEDHRDDVVHIDAHELGCVLIDGDGADGRPDAGMVAVGKIWFISMPD